MTRKEDFLQKYVIRLRWLYAGILLVFILSISMLLMRIQDIESFIDLSLTTRAEGSLSENNSFINTFITELNKKRTKKDIIEEKEARNRIAALLEEIQSNIYINIKPVDPPNDYKGNINEKTLDGLSYTEAKYYLRPSIAEKLSIKSLNLVPKTDEITDSTSKKKITEMTSLRNSDAKTDPKSFLYIPARMVIKETKGVKAFDIPHKLKKEIVFSKCIEEYLLELLRNEKTAKQAYFISVNGFMRICRKDANNQVSYFKGNFMFNHIFDERPYIFPTLEKNFSYTLPYVDTAGMGIVKTYTVRVIHERLGIVGIIGIDRPLVPQQQLKELIRELSLGSWTPLFKRFWLEFCPDLREDGLKYSRLLKDKEIKEIGEYYNKYKDQLFSEVQRFPQQDQDTTGHRPGRIIYTIPLENKELAIVIFDSNKVKLNNWVSFLVILLIVVLIAVGITYTYLQSIKKIKSARNSLDIISHMGHSYVITDKNNKIAYYNDEFKRLVAKEHDQIKDKSFLEFLTEAGATDYQYLLQSKKDRFECTIEVVGKGNKLIQAILIDTKTDYPLIRDPRISIIIQSDYLESMVAQKYIGRISHILKTPLHSILGIADQLRRKSSRKRFNEYFSILDAEINSLSSSLSKLLSISRVEYKHLRPEFEKFDLTRLIKNIEKEIIKKLTKQKGIKFKTTINPGISLISDADLIKVAVENILDNAIKYTLDGHISLNLYDERSNAKIIIEDSGIGIAWEDIDKIFDKGFRGNHKVVKQREGQGIGLYQCKQYINLCGGKIHIKSIKESGTTFTVILPKNPQHSESSDDNR